MCSQRVRPSPRLVQTLRDLYSSPSIRGIIKSRRVRWAGHVSRMGEKRTACRLLYEIQKERDH
jgi:hypothetical protein